MPNYIGSTCCVCKSKIDADNVFILKLMRIAGREVWLPMHCICAVRVKRGIAKLPSAAQLIDDYVAVPRLPDDDDGDADPETAS